MNTILVLTLLLLPLGVNAQQGSGVKALASFPKLIATPKTNLFLVWESAAKKFAFYYGVARAEQTNRLVISTNRYPIKAGLTYSVAPITDKGVELAAARDYWPPIPIGELWEQSSVDLRTWKNERLLERYTNAPATPRMFLRVVNKVTGKYTGK